MRVFNLVLLIDDSFEDNYIHKRLLQQTGVTEHIVVCNDGEDAFHYLSKKGKYEGWDKEYHLPDLIFLDINMPKVNGFEFLSLYQELSSSLKKAPVIVMISTSQNPRDHEQAKKFKEVVDFITKPLDEEQLNSIIERYFL